MDFGYASRETSHKSSAVNPVGPQPLPQRPEGKMPPPRGGQPRRLQSGQLEHRERWSCGSAPSIRTIGAHLLPAPIPFLASSPSKDRPNGRIPTYDTGSWTRWVALRMDLRDHWFPSVTWLSGDRSIMGQEKAVWEIKEVKDGVQVLPVLSPSLLRSLPFALSRSGHSCLWSFHERG